MKSSKLQFEGSGADVDSMEGFGALLDPFLDRGFFGARQSDEELTKKLKRVCGVLSQIEDCNARDVEEKRKVCRLAGSIAKSQIYRHENSEVRAFAACVVVELSRFVDNPFAEEKTVSVILFECFNDYFLQLTIFVIRICWIS